MKPEWRHAMVRNLLLAAAILVVPATASAQIAFRPEDVGRNASVFAQASFDAAGSWTSFRVSLKKAWSAFG